MDSRGSKQRRVRWSGEEIRELIGRYENSGQTQIEFCREWGLALSSFQTYLRKHRKAGAAEKRAGVEPSHPRLVEVEIESAQHTPNEPSKLEVILPNGYRGRAIL
jgi:transposase-like protein